MTIKHFNFLQTINNPNILPYYNNILTQILQHYKGVIDKFYIPTPFTPQALYTQRKLLYPLFLIRYITDNTIRIRRTIIEIISLNEVSSPLNLEITGNYNVSFLP